MAQYQPGTDAFIALTFRLLHSVVRSLPFTHFLISSGHMLFIHS